MTDLALLLALQRDNPGCLGFIPSTTLANRYLANGQYLISHHPHAGKVGYLLFSPPRRDKVLHITQCCLEYDYRRRTRATQLVEQLKRIALDAGCTEIQLRCAVQLDANAFWAAIGARLLATYTPATETSHPINHYAIDLDTLPPPLFRGLNLTPEPLCAYTHANPPTPRPNPTARLFYAPRRHSPPTPKLLWPKSDR